MKIICQHFWMAVLFNASSLSYGYDYVSKIGYDKFEQRTYLKYCNGAETFYTYDPQRRRLQNLNVNSGGNTIMDNAYTYDAVSNVLSVVNGASVPQSGKAGGQMAHNYTYDALYRLVGATGTYTRQQATPLQWATTTCTVSHRSVKSLPRTMCSLMVR